MNEIIQKLGNAIKIEKHENGDTSVSYVSPDIQSTPFGDVPTRTLSVRNQTEEGAFSSFVSSLKANGYNVENNIWQ